MSQRNDYLHEDIKFPDMHINGEWAEKIRREYDTGCRFLVEGVTEDEALLKETEEIKRVLDETTDILTNKVTPIGAKRRGLWYKPCSDSPALEFEHAPSMYVTEIEKHYFDRKGRQFDPVNEALLQRPYLINDIVIDEINATVYHNEYERYYKEVVDALENKAGCKILSSKYAKSVTAWIYAGAISLEFYESTQEYLRNNYDRKIPSIHLMDVWKYLKATKQLFLQSISAQAITIQLSGEKGHNKRCAITEIRNYGDWQKGYEEGSSLCFEGDKAQKEGNLDKAIELFDKARYCGYIGLFVHECG